jgi:hypothetical protein
MSRRRGRRMPLPRDTTSYLTYCLKRDKSESIAKMSDFSQFVSNLAVFVITLLNSDQVGDCEYIKA